MTTSHTLDTESTTLIVRALYDRRITDPHSRRIADHLTANDPAILGRLSRNVVRWLNTGLECVHCNRPIECKPFGRTEAGSPIYRWLPVDGDAPHRCPTARDYCTPRSA